MASSWRQMHFVGRRVLAWSPPLGGCLDKAGSSNTGNPSQALQPRGTTYSPTHSGFGEGCPPKDRLSEGLHLANNVRLKDGPELVVQLLPRALIRQGKVEVALIRCKGHVGWQVGVGEAMRCLAVKVDYEVHLRGSQLVQEGNIAVRVADQGCRGAKRGPWRAAVGVTVVRRYKRQEGG